MQLEGGNVVVTWARSNIENGGTEPVYQVLNQDGTPIGSTRVVQSSDNTLWESPAKIVALDNGNWMAVWIDNGYSDDTPTMTLDARIFDASGNPVTNDIRISNDAVDGWSGYDVENFSAEVLGNGNVVVGYVENSVTGGHDNSPQFTIVSPNGSIVAQDVEIAQNNTHPWPGAPVIEALGDSGAFVAVYAEGNQASGGATGLNFRIYDGNGNAITNEITIVDRHDNAAMSGLDHFDWSNLDVDYNETNDTFTVSWVGQNDGSKTGVYTSGPIAGVSGNNGGSDFGLGGNPQGGTGDLITVPSEGGSFTGVVWDKSDITSSGTFAGLDPFLNSTGGLSTSKIQGASFTLRQGAVPVTVGISDGDGQFNDGDGSQVLANNESIDGNFESAGSRITPEYQYLVQEAGTGRQINILAVEFDGNDAVGIVSDAPLQAGVQYNFVRLVTSLPSLSYNQFTNQYFA